MRTLFLFLTVVLLISCHSGEGELPPIRYTKGDLWVSNFRNRNFPSKTLADDKIYCSSLEISDSVSELLYCLDLKTGIVNWTAEVANWASDPPIVGDSFIYYSSFVGDIYRFDKNGNKIWEQQAKSAFSGHCLNPLNNNLIIHTVSNGSYELAFNNGEVVNHFAKACLGSSRPVFYEQYMIQAGIKDDTTVIGKGALLRCIDYTNKKKLWEYPMGENIDPVFVNGGKLYFMTKGHIMHAVDIKTGVQLWQSDTLKQVGYYTLGLDLVFDRGKIIYFETNLEDVVVLDQATGKVITSGSYHEILNRGLMRPVSHNYRIPVADSSYYSVCVSDSLETPHVEYNVYVKKISR